MSTLKPLAVCMLIFALLQPRAPAVAQDDAAAADDTASDTVSPAEQSSDAAATTADETPGAAPTAQETSQAAPDAAAKAPEAAPPAQSVDDQASEPTQQTTAASTDKINQDAKDLQKQVDAQSALITAQAASGKSTNAQLADLQKTLDQQKALIAAQEKQLSDQQAQLKNTTDLLTSMQSQIDQLKQDQGDDLSDDEVAMRERLSQLEAQVGKIPDDPSTLLADEDFPGSIRVPGTTSSYKFGGYVKVNVLRNFEPLVTQDRFIVGSIPVTASDQTALANEMSLTANQTRFNFDYRQKSSSGTLRAFIEGDFAGSNDTFRLRHAFGQFRDILAGKTWSAFYDAQAAPERIDFEGINGRVVVRQTQVRYFPQIGQDYRLMISFEDPNPQVTGAEGVSNLPDVVTSIRREWFGGWHVKTALLLRQIGSVNNSGLDINGQPCEPVVGTPPGASDIEGCVAVANPGLANEKFAWGISVSGKVKVSKWNKNDNFLFQLNYGPGLGRYLTDLSSIDALGIDGGQDAIIDPATGNMETLGVFGGYVGFQHWWGESMRSTFVYSFVDIDNQHSQYFNAYSKTQRLSGNLIWSPIPNIDLGAEFMWGRRENKGIDPVSGNQTGSATQLQLEAVYRF